MKKIFAAFLALMILLSSGCMMQILDSLMSKGSYDSAKEYAEDRCGPCKEVDVEEVTLEDGSEVEIHYMKDKEYGFTYQVIVTYRKYATSRKPVPSYICEDFDYYYLLEFLDEDPLEDIVEKYDLTIELNEPEDGVNEGVYLYYSPTMKFWTDLELSQDEIDDILSTAYYALEDFDDRQRFTENAESHSVFLHVFCAPSERDKELGKKYGGGSSRFGYRYER